LFIICVTYLIIRAISVYFSIMFKTYNDWMMDSLLIFKTCIPLPLKSNALYFVSLVWPLWKWYISLADTVVCSVLSDIFNLTKTNFSRIFIRWNRQKWCILNYLLFWSRRWCASHWLKKSTQLNTKTLTWTRC